MTKLDRLGGLIREVEPAFGKALQENSPYLSWLDADLQLSYSQCGIATAALQLYLAEACRVKTDRRIASISFPATRSARSYEVEHVILQTDEEQTICPTYTQFYELVGLSPSLAQDYDDMRALLPEQKIAVFPAREAQLFGEQVGEHALEIRADVKKALSTRALSFYRGGTNVYENVTREILIAGYRSIWGSDSYRPFPFTAQIAGKNGDRYDECVRNIVDAI